MNGITSFAFWIGALLVGVGVQINEAWFIVLGGTLMLRSSIIWIRRDK